MLDINKTIYLRGKRMEYTNDILNILVVDVAKMQIAIDARKRHLLGIGVGHGEWSLMYQEAKKEYLDCINCLQKKLDLE